MRIFSGVRIMILQFMIFLIPYNLNLNHNFNFN